MNYFARRTTRPRRTLVERLWLTAGVITMTINLMAAIIWHMPVLNISAAFLAGFMTFVIWDDTR